MRTRFAPIALIALVATCGPSRPPLRQPLDALVAELRSAGDSDLRSLIVVSRGHVITEAYFNGAAADELHDARSVGKSITSLLVGIAIDRGLIANVDVRLVDVLGVEASKSFAAITLADVLTMRAGLAADDTLASSPGNEDRMDAAPDWLAFALTVPAAVTPGTTYQYNSLTAFLAGAAVEEASGSALADFAAEHLFGPLGIRAHRWRRGPRGEGAGQGNLSLRARDLATIGELVLGGGALMGRRVVSEAWVLDSLTPHVAIADVDRYADHYGYMWYGKTYDVEGEAVLVAFASGNGGNKIYVVPSRHGHGATARFVAASVRRSISIAVPDGRSAIDVPRRGTPAVARYRRRALC